MGAHVSVPMYRRTIPERLRLEGRWCQSCETMAFPSSRRCRRCSSTETVVVALSGKGVIYALTAIDRLGAPPEFAEQTRRSGGYHVGIVVLAEGPAITGQIVSDARTPRIDDRVHAVTRRLYEEEGVVRYGFKFELDLRESTS